MAVKTLIEAIRDAMDEEMERDPSVFVIGEDVGVRGGVFLATDGLANKYGEDRVIDSPLAESSIVRVALAAAAKGLVKAAIRDPEPVLFLEHKRTYRLIRGEVPDGDHLVAIGTAEVRREGKDLSLIAYGLMLHYCLEAAEKLAGEGVSVEVLDLRSIKPMDDAAILKTTRKTGKVLIVHEDNQFGGIAGEVMAIIMESAFDALDAPVMRLCGPDVPAMPYNHVLEAAFMPSVDRIAEKARELAAY